MNIYQVFTRLFRNDSGKNIHGGDISQNGSSKFHHFDINALQAIYEMGYTHIWFTGIIRHASTTGYEKYNIFPDHPSVVKGKAGSPYAIKDYFDVDPDLAQSIPDRMSEFEALVERCHQVGLKIIIDFVPNHVSRQYNGANRPDGIPDLGENDDTSQFFSPANNFYYNTDEPLQLPQEAIPEGAENYYENPAKATGNNVFHSHPGINDWYETIKLNYGIDFNNGATEYFDPVPQTWLRMLEILKYWAGKKVDGFRVDMAEMVPVAFWKWLIPKVKSVNSDLIFIAEIYQIAAYSEYLDEGGFDFLYDKEQFYNTIRAILERKAGTSAISDIWKAQNTYSSRMLRFMENHDEQRLASDFFAGDGTAGIPAMLLTATMHQGPVMVYFGQEIGESGMDNEGYSGTDGRTSIFDYWRIEAYQQWVGKGQFDDRLLNEYQKNLRKQYVEILQLRNQFNEVLQNGGFYDLMWVNQHADTANLYAYIRHTSDNVLLIVLNFGPHEKQIQELFIPGHAISHIDLQPQGALRAKSIWGEHQDVDFDVDEQGTQRGCFQLPEFGGCVFTLK